MRLIRVYTAAPLAAGGTTTLDGPAAGHVTRVLRLRAGAPLTLFNGDGWDYRGTLVAVRGARVEVALAGRDEAAPESPLALTLVQGISRGERMDLVMQKGTELGVARFVPVVTARSVVRPDARQATRKLAHWRSVVIAACEQSGRARLPDVEAPLALEAWLACPGAAQRVLLESGAEPLATLQLEPGPIELLIGPEGGLEPHEREQAVVAGYAPRALGPRVLRTETAALAAIAVLQATHGDLR